MRSSSARATSRRLRVDPVACDGFGYCAELVPELVWLDEWGYPVLDDADVPPRLRSLVGQAVQACPRRALLLERVPTEKPLAHGTGARAAVEPRRPRVVASSRAARTATPGRRRVQYPDP